MRSIARPRSVVARGLRSRRACSSRSVGHPPTRRRRRRHDRSSRCRREPRALPAARRRDRPSGRSGPALRPARGDRRRPQHVGRQGLQAAARGVVEVGARFAVDRLPHRSDGALARRQAGLARATCATASTLFKDPAFGSPVAPLITNIDSSRCAIRSPRSPASSATRPSSSTTSCIRSRSFRSTSTARCRRRCSRRGGRRASRSAPDGSVSRSGSRARARAHRRHGELPRPREARSHHLHARPSRPSPHSVLQRRRRLLRSVPDRPRRASSTRARSRAAIVSRSSATCSSR